MRLHTKVSLAKSIFRIIAAASLIGGYFLVAGVNFIIAEVLGIAEEIDS